MHTLIFSYVSSGGELKNVICQVCAWLMYVIVSYDQMNVITLVGTLACGYTNVTECTGK